MDAWLGRNQELYRRCERRNGDLLRHVSTADTARDLERLRRAVGGRGLNSSEYPTGRSLGATFANLFPDRVRALMLDGERIPKAYVSPEIEERRPLLTSDLRAAADLGRGGTLEPPRPLRQHRRRPLRVVPRAAPARRGRNTRSCWRGSRPIRRRADLASCR